jgi:hypothetical protein
MRCAGHVRASHCFVKTAQQHPAEPRKGAGYRPRDGSAKPGADAFPNGISASGIERPENRSVPCRRPYGRSDPQKTQPKKEDPGTPGGGQGLFAGWVRGWGAGGHTTRRLTTKQPSRPSGSGPSKFSCSRFPSRTIAKGTVSARHRREIGRQPDLPAIGKLQVPQVDTAIVALDDIASANRKMARETDLGTHGTVFLVRISPPAMT